MSSRVYSAKLSTDITPKRIMVIGCGGSGKSTLSRKIAAITKLPLTHMDTQFFKPNWVEPSKEEWEQKVETMAAEEKWILEGNYSGTFPIRLKKADLVIWLDRPMPLCLWRVIKRSIVNYGKTRPDMALGCRDRISLSFLHYVAIFPWVGRKRIIQKLKHSPFKFEVVQLKNKKEIQALLSSLNH